jgi:ribonuclease-3
VAIEELAQTIGYEFTCPDLLVEALTHPSAPSSSRRGRGGRRAAGWRTYERLEFLGDRVLGLVIADLLWRQFPAEPEGGLSRRYHYLVRLATLARVATAIGLDRHLVLAPSEAAAGADRNPSILSDVCEAVIAAIYIDGGFPAAFAFVEHWWKPLIAEVGDPPLDPKTALQEWAQARGLALPAYALIETSGPHHAPRFTVEARLAGWDGAVASASSKRGAETRAAAALLDRLTGKTDDAAPAH